MEAYGSERLSAVVLVAMFGAYPTDTTLNFPGAGPNNNKHFDGIVYNSSSIVLNKQLKLVNFLH